MPPSMRCRSMSSGESLNGLNMGPRRSSSLKGRGARQRRRFPGACRTHGAHGAVPERALSWPGRQLVGHGSVDGLYGHVVRSGAHTSARVTCQCSRVGIVRSYESKYVKIPVKKRFVALGRSLRRAPRPLLVSPRSVFYNVFLPSLPGGRRHMHLGIKSPPAGFITPGIKFYL